MHTGLVVSRLMCGPPERHLRVKYPTPAMSKVLEAFEKAGPIGIKHRK